MTVQGRAPVSARPRVVTTIRASSWSRKRSHAVIEVSSVHHHLHITDRYNPGLELMRLTILTLLLALTISTAAAPAASKDTPLRKSYAPIVEVTQSPSVKQLKLGSSKTNPVYVIMQCEHGCGFAEDRRSFWGKIWTDPVAAFTVVLAISTIGLWSVTKSMADTSKKALLDLERPIVFGGVSKPGLNIVSTGLERSHLELSIYNHGRTMARLRRIEWKVCLAEKETIPPPIDPSAIGGRELPPGTVCVSGDPYSESENLSFKWDMDTVEKIASGELSVWVIGFVRYDDVFQHHLISGFTQVFDPIGSRFVRRGSVVYNYERPERSKDIPSPSSNC